MPSIPPAGISPAAAYGIIGYAVQEPPPAILADKIDPYTGDFETLLEGRGLADAFAIEAIRIQRGTGAAVRDVGNRYRQVSHVEDGNALVIESMTREAFEAAEQAGLVRVVSVRTEPDEADPGQLNTLIEYRDLLAPKAEPTRRLVFAL